MEVLYIRQGCQYIPPGPTESFSPWVVSRTFSETVRVFKPHRVVDHASLSAFWLYFATGSSTLQYPGQWTMANFLSNWTAVSRFNICSLYLISFPVEVSSPFCWYMAPCTWAVAKA